MSVQSILRSSRLTKVLTEKMFKFYKFGVFSFLKVSTNDGYFLKGTLLKTKNKN